ncbi:transcriptional regulator, TetR family [Clostridiales bacterium oral taxon 876 str. F0540]|nr:transcriptional regulator, TetR family [Clostridiales bacterium oral taxon 876 str. F0540]
MKNNANNDSDKAAVTQSKILEAAEELFAEKGYDGARVDEIAKRAGVNKALIYYYFENKQKILEEIIKKHISEARTLKEKLLKDVNTFNKDDREKFFDLTFEYLKGKKDLLRIITIEALKADSDDVSIFKFLLPSLPKMLAKMDKMGVEVEDPLSIMIYSFFFGLIPASAYFTLADKWADYYEISKEEADKKFIDVYKKVYLSYYDKLMK